MPLLLFEINYLYIITNIFNFIFCWRETNNIYILKSNLKKHPLSKKNYSKRLISRVAEVFFGKHLKKVRNADYEAKGIEYMSYTRDDFEKGILGNISSEMLMLKDTLKYDLLKYKSDTEIEYYKSNEVYRIYSLGQGYLLLSVCKYIRDKK